MTKEDLVFEWEPRVPINEDIAAIEHKLVDDYVFVDNNINNRDDTDNLTDLSKNEINSLNNNKGIEILNDSIVELGDTPIQIIDTENIQNENTEYEEESINNTNVQPENTKEECGENTNM